MWKKRLQQIKADEEEYGGGLRKPASELQIIELSAAVLMKSGVVLPKAYKDFLRCADGLDYNGHTVLGVAKDEEDLQMLETNKFFREDDEHLRRYWFYGESDDSWYVYDKKTGKYLDMDPCEDIYAQFDTFEAFLDHILKDSLDEDDEDEEEEDVEDEDEEDEDE